MFEPSAYSDTATNAAKPGDQVLSTLSKVVGSQTANIEGWAALINAIGDPRQRVATLTAKIKNYKIMRAKYGVGPIKDLYSNQIRLMQERLKAEKVNLARVEASERSTDTWRGIGHSLGYVAIGVGVLTGVFVLSRAVR